MDGKYPKEPILLVDDEEEVLKGFTAILRSAGMNNVVAILRSEEVLPFLSARQASVILLDLIIPAVPGTELLDSLRNDYPETPVIIVTGTEDLYTAVECMKKGAFDYLVKVVEENTLIASVRRAVEMQELKSENLELKRRFLSSEITHPQAFEEIITRSPKLKSIFLYMEAIAAIPKPVLITGETGTGKELIARALHRLSGRRGRYIAVNISSFDDTLFSDTVFGHKKGAFTGADMSESGLIESAAGGTLFLDEIGDLSPPSQVKLLRLLENGEYLPLGSSFMKKSEARIIVATNKNIENEVEEGRFRRDLYYRLFTHHIKVPPLRERREDIPLLVEHFFTRTAEELARDRPDIPGELLNILEGYPFPGNVRELESLIQDAMSRSTEEKFLWEKVAERIGIRTPPAPENDKNGHVIFLEKMPTIKQVTEKLIDEALDRAGGNQTVAAKMLGISQQALSRRLKQRNTT